MNLSDHFTADETGYFDTPPEFRPNVLATVALLERLRVTWRNTRVLVKKRIYRAPARNASLPGASSSSQHLDATAADVNAMDLTYEEALSLVEADTELRQRFGQFISYRSGSHFHISLPTRGVVGEILEQTSEDPAAPAYVARAPATTVELGLEFAAENRDGLLVALLLLGGISAAALSVRS